MNQITEKAWEVFRSAFKDGEYVVVETDLGVFYYGKLKSFNDALELTRIDRHSVVIPWDKVEFIAHDGFPRLKTKNGHEIARDEAIPKISPLTFLPNKVPSNHGPERQYSQIESVQKCNPIVRNFNRNHG